MYFFSISFKFSRFEKRNKSILCFYAFHMIISLILYQESYYANKNFRNKRTALIGNLVIEKSR